MSDEWRAYINIPTWAGFNYTHRTINHQENFVNPINGANTQRIETHWGHIKTKLVCQMHGTSLALLPSHLAEYWWRQKHPQKPFLDFLELLRLYFPLT